MIDTHAHLNFPQLYNQIDKIVADSKKAGVTEIILASSNLKDSRISVELAQKYPNYLFASVGIHPQKTDPENHFSIEYQLLELENIIKRPQKILNSKFEILNNDQKSNFQMTKTNIIALGETGLDFSPAPPGEENRSKEDQVKLFLGQINLAQKYDLPLIIHAREAVDEVIEILQSLKRTVLDKDCPSRRTVLFSPHGVFHCYAGGKKRVQKILDLEMSLRGLSRAEAREPDEAIPTKSPNLNGIATPRQGGARNDSGPNWYFGFDGNLTYDEGLQNILSMIPEDKILIETDAPFLAPIPHRGETNYPFYLPLIQQKINEIFRKDLTARIRQNTQNLFRLNSPTHNQAIA